MKKLILALIFASFCFSKEIARVPEASGITYVGKSKSLIVANDEGFIYELSLKGKIKRKVYLGRYDLEGVVYDESRSRLLFCAEKKNLILVVDVNTLELVKEIKVSKKYKKKKILGKYKNEGLEAITIANGRIYLSNQSTSFSNSFVFEVEIKGDKAEIVKTIHHGYIDIAGLDYYDGHLYMVSDRKNLLIKYSLYDEVVVYSKRLKRFAQEGITFDDNGYTYIADDKGKIERFKTKKLLSK